MIKTANYWGQRKKGKEKKSEKKVKLKEERKENIYKTTEK